MKALGLDLSLTAPGLVLLSRVAGQKVVETVIAEQIPVPKADKVGRWERVGVIGDHVASVIEAHHPGVVVIEGYGQVSHGGVQSFVKCVEVGTVVRLVLWGNNLKWLEVPPTSLKKFVCATGKLQPGKKGKKQFMAHVAERWGFETTNDNIADAYGLARFGLAKAGVVPVEPWQVDVIDKVQTAQCN